MSLHFVVRRATPADADGIAEAHMHSIHSFGAKAYSSEIVADWGKFRTGEIYRSSMEKGQPFFVAVDANDRILGFSSHSVEAGLHRTAIYIRGGVERQGVGSALFRRAEQVAREQGATENSRRLFIGCSRILSRQRLPRDRRRRAQAEKR